MNERIVSFVMSGGVGSRLWPLSREDNPKQFHDLAGDGSMLVKTVRRLTERPEGETPVFLIAAERHAGRIRADLAGICSIPDDHIDPRRSAFFMARSVLRDIRGGMLAC